MNAQPNLNRKWITNSNIEIAITLLEFRMKTAYLRRLWRAAGGEWTRRSRRERWEGAGAALRISAW